MRSILSFLSLKKLCKHVISKSLLNMKKFIAVIISSLFLLWLLPLGVFIKPSMQKLVCNGQRAICQCSHLAGKNDSLKIPGQFVYKSSGETQKEGMSPFGSHHYLWIRYESFVDKTFSHDFLDKVFLYSLFVLPSIEHIPKSTSS